MKVGLQVVRFNWPGAPENTGETLARIARTADEAGFASLWVMDHYYQIAPGLGAEDDPMLEGYSVLNYLAGFTEKLRLGTLVSGVIYRQPAFLVKAATTLDVLSGGRAYFGVGAAWYEAEARGLGFPFPPLKDRFEMLEETLQIAERMWEDDRTPYAGKHFRLDKPIHRPAPLTKPHPPILIGGMGERKTLRMVAEYGDACNLFTRVGNEELEHKLQALRRHCDALGRDFDDIEVTTLTTVHLNGGEDTPDQVVRSCEEWAEMGVDHAIFNIPNVHEIEPLEVFGQSIIPTVAEF